MRQLLIPVDIKFSDYGIFPGMTILVWYQDRALYPRRFTGVVDTTFQKFALVRTDTGYRTTMHITDLACRMARIIPTDGSSLTAPAATG